VGDELSSPTKEVAVQRWRHVGIAAILAAATAGVAATGAGRRQATGEAAIDAIFATWNHPDSPGCTVGAIRDGRLVFQKGYGMANLDYAIPNSPAMVYYVGSVSKQFTAAAIALLAQDGRISLDDPVRRYITELPDYGAPLTIRHLVHHTSGLRDIYTLMSLGGIRMADVFPDEDALELIVRQRALNFAPGEDYLYSNSGYWLLGQIVERVTGESLREYARRAIFEPLGMTRTHFHDDPGHVMANRVVSYARAGDRYAVADLANFDKIGAGGLYTTIDDLRKWDANFYDPRVGGPKWLDAMHTVGRLNNGTAITYAFGLTLGTHRGLRTVRHGGSLMGFRAELLRFPDQRFTAIVLCNLATIAPAGLAERVAAVYLGDRMSPAPAAGARAGGAGGGRGATPASDAAAASLSPASLAAYAGTYRSEEVQADYVIRVAYGRLVLGRRIAPPTPLQPAGPDAFRAGTLTLRFTRDPAGRVVSFTVEAGRVRNIAFTRVR
jgi:CubicO group peptidase (beta-lactamase class C family)